MKQNILLDKTFAFSLQIIELARKLQAVEKEYVLSRQLLKAATSIGANVEEAMGGQSPADFLSRLTIAHKEARETKYWLRLIKESKLNDCSHQLDSIDEILRIIVAILKTTKQNSIKPTVQTGS